MMDTQPYIVYVKVDETSRVTNIKSSAFLENTEGWTQIDSGNTYKHYHARGNYLDKPIYDDRGIPCYKLEDGKPVERTQDEMDADYAARPAPEMTDKERIAALEEQIEMLLSGVTADE